MMNPFAPATEAQIRFAEAIVDRLGIELPEEKTKAAYSDFISEWKDDFEDECYGIDMWDVYDER